MFNVNACASSRTTRFSTLFLALAVAATPCFGQAGPPSVVVSSPAELLAAMTPANEGKRIFAGRCTVCHGLGAVAAGYAPDLRASPIPLDVKSFADVVQGGLLESRALDGELGRLRLRKPDVDRQAVGVDRFVRQLANRFRAVRATCDLTQARERRRRHG